MSSQGRLQADTHSGVITLDTNCVKSHCVSVTNDNQSTMVRDDSGFLATDTALGGERMVHGRS